MPTDGTSWTWLWWAEPKVEPSFRQIPSPRVASPWWTWLPRTSKRVLRPTVMRSLRLAVPSVMAFSTSLPSTSTSLEPHTRMPDEAVARVWFCSITTWLLSSTWMPVLVPWGPVFATWKPRTRIQLAFRISNRPVHSGTVTLAPSTVTVCPGYVAKTISWPAAPLLVTTTSPGSCRP